MASTYTQNGGIELIADGEQDGEWGQTTNTNLQIVDRLTNGVGAITLSGTSSTLETTNGGLSLGQYKMLVFGGSPSGTHTVTLTPNTAEKIYFVKNNTGQNVVITQGSGGNVTIANGKSAIVFSDGGGSAAAVTDLTSTFSFASLSGTETLTNKTITFADNTLTGVASTTTAQTLTNKTLTAPTISGTVVEDVHVLTGTSVALDPANGSIQVHLLSGNVTYTNSFSNGEAITLMILPDTAGRTATFPTTTWVNNAGVAPSPLSSAGYTVVALWQIGDGGSAVLFGAVVGTSQ